MDGHIRQHAHDLIDQLPESQISGVVRFLETIADPADAALRNAPCEDEAISMDEERAIAEARDRFRNNPGIPHAEAMRRLGLD